MMKAFRLEMCTYLSMQKFEDGSLIPPPPPCTHKRSLKLKGIRYILRIYFNLRLGSSQIF
jgi:hypothetical protein